MTEENQQESQQHEFGPGALLKRTREEQSLSLEEVSTRLKLPLPVLNKIEKDDYDGDLPVTFYRGYLKNYAELLGVEDVDIGANFQSFCQKNNLLNTPPQKLHGLQGVELERVISSSNWLFRIITALIILALVGAIYYMVVEKELWKKFMPTDQEAQQESSNLDGLPIGQADGDELVMGTVGTETAESVSEEPEAANEASPDVTDGGVLADEEGELPLGGMNEETSASVEASSSIAPDGALSLSFSDDCWIKIEDATGKVLSQGIQSAGSDLQLSGQAPYRLTLGKASAVQLAYDGETVDLSNYPDTRAAKLTLGDE